MTRLLWKKKRNNVWKVPQHFIQRSWKPSRRQAIKNEEDPDNKKEYGLDEVRLDGNTVFWSDKNIGDGESFAIKLKYDMNDELSMTESQKDNLNWQR